MADIPLSAINGSGESFKTSAIGLLVAITSVTAVTTFTCPDGGILIITYLRAPPTVNATQVEIRVGGRVVSTNNIMGADGDVHFDGAAAMSIGGGSTATPNTSPNTQIIGGVDEDIDIERFAGATSSIFVIIEERIPA